MIRRFIVEYADGNNFERRFFSECAVEAGGEVEARLVAEQLVYAQHAGKPAYIQILSTRVRK